MNWTFDNCTIVLASWSRVPGAPTKLWNEIKLYVSALKLRASFVYTQRDRYTRHKSRTQHDRIKNAKIKKNLQRHV